jgi:OmpA-OmpF porin, OOP family
VTHHLPLAAWRALPAPMAAAAMLFSTLLTQPAVADDGGLYVGASLGYTLSTYHRSDLNNALIGTFAGAGYTLVLDTSSVHDEQRPWSLDIGYRFSRYLALEASYLELGTLKYAGGGTETSYFGRAPITVDLNIKSRGPALALVGVLPMTNDWNLEARLGAYEGKTLTQYVTTVDTTPTSGHDSKSSASLLADIGASYILNAHWVLRLDYIHLNQLGEKILSKSFNVDLLTAGVTYAF